MLHFRNESYSTHHSNKYRVKSIVHYVLILVCANQLVGVPLHYILSYRMHQLTHHKLYHCYAPYIQQPILYHHTKQINYHIYLTPHLRKSRVMLVLNQQ